MKRTAKVFSSTRITRLGVVHRPPTFQWSFLIPAVVNWEGRDKKLPWWPTFLQSFSLISNDFITSFHSSVVYPTDKWLVLKSNAERKLTTVRNILTNYKIIYTYFIPTSFIPSYFITILLSMEFWRVLTKQQTFFWRHDWRPFDTHVENSWLNSTAKFRKR